MVIPLKRILLSRTDRIGDVVLTTPAVSLLRNYFPNLHITFLANAYTEPLLERHRFVDEILVYDKNGRHRGIAGHLRLLQDVRQRHFDAAILFYPRPALAAVFYLARIPIRIGTAYRWYSSLLNRKVPLHRRQGEKHELLHNLTLLKPLIPTLPSKIQFEFEVTPEWQAAILQKFRLNDRYCIIHPGSGGSAPNLSHRQYQYICRYLLKYSDLQLIFTGTGEEAAAIESISRPLDSRRIVNTAGLFDIAQLMAAISGAKLLISSSTGPLHIAAALDIPVISYYCPAPPVAPRWGPYHQLEWVLVAPVSPCEHGRTDQCPHGNCLEKIPDRQLREMLERRLVSIGYQPKVRQ